MRTIFCVPGRNCPGDKTITARVISASGEIREFYFGSDMTLDRCAYLIPRIDGRIIERGRIR